jgi:hypothetical protein
MTNNVALWTIIGLLAVVAVIVAAIASRRRARITGAELRRRFGPEYDRTVQELGSARRAERVLAARARRVEHIRFQELSDADRARFEWTWSRIQAKFVDDPAAAVASANELIKEVMLARGYPAEGFEQRVADLSVEHPEVVQHYRAARTLSDAHRKEPIATEELRQAVVHYRAMFADLLQEHGAKARPLHEIPETTEGRDVHSSHLPQH